MDINSISAGLGALKAAIDITKEIQNASSSLEKAQMKLKLAEITENLATAKLQFVEAQEEIVDLRQQINALHQLTDLKNKIVKKGNVLYPKEDESEFIGDGPWCTRCFEVDNILVSLHHKTGFVVATSHSSAASYKWECPSCKANLSAPKPNEL